MATIRFAFLAEYAKAEPTGTVTALQAGLERVTVDASSQSAPLHLASVIVQDGEGDAAQATLTVTTTAPDELYSLSQSIDLPAPQASTPSTTAFAVRIDIPVVGEGIYRIDIGLGEEVAVSIPLRIDLQAAEHAQSMS
ncbi:DUF6941 family protein [Curtobacterium flaccumfaciens]|jgi:Flp pilus assembly protein TadG|uniref:DUF6941 family protein n=1 Tax=Curtobacterium flaccumfaciens TaxID=2035 RepID=UPI001BDDD76D|nr:hypothetical protein [Curtobacterium flaccumfaciens]MBT1607292.1 hypothetical protein [Curtobacterium flaccumfaciens pv. betae]MBT1656811.1 hypothetical protein [Curtobacterium flaccumfaciens pv. betae]MCS0472326.1 hypothetical protein [Curtobacterium flaccumfaciens pv. betae]MCS0473878.1 hypothetical protein [Curtobacterium flaccumfaciens pv. betae]MCS0479066.1 hypothetical protein [Curtobacterium flaccumfaciens pv. betae]